MAPKGEFGAHTTIRPAATAAPFACLHERSAMAEVAVEVPAALVPCVRETVVMQYRAALEALHLAFGEPEAAPEEVRHGRERLGRLDALLDRLGWPGEPVPAAIRLAAP